MGEHDAVAGSDGYGAPGADRYGGPGAADAPQPDGAVRRDHTPQVSAANRPNARPRKRATMADVARLAGVSQTTVSFVINERPGSGIPEETRQRVLSAVRDLGFQPNRQARNLRTRRTHQLGFHISGEQLDFHNVFAVSFLQPLLREAERRGYHLLVFTAGDDVVERLAELVAGHSVDGFVITDSSIDDPRVRYLAGAGMPFASFGRTETSLPQSWVDVDNAAGIGAMVDHLVAKGHERIAYVGPSRSGYWFTERLEGFRARMKRHGLAVPPSWLVRADAGQAEAAVWRLLRARRRPTAVVTAGDALAVEAIRSVRAAGLEVGRDVAVTGFDGGPLQWLTDPPLTTVRLPFEQAAAVLVERCLREIEEGPTKEPGQFLPTEILVGGSG
ncbi:LacI family transcriptional regulator [Micromonospora sp. KC606]|uniref:LacI family DNA-binding transcriptional regulator n=1 Tax=Micromonospora sp. KC606 TaxID=2530379 RepID=UPI00104CEBC5|nr:LacI family DNA-binding transcriptional regulator [Micromonospora sp. KC606]TDC75810.1 LacI family transcriptional regulator [Micromonospora sp. KC606]